MSTISADLPLGALVCAWPASAPLLAALRLDYCCAGNQTLGEACKRRGLDVHTVCALLEALQRTALRLPAVERADWQGASLADLCGHIVDHHHTRLRLELPRIESLVETVVGVHGGSHAELVELRRTFGELARSLLTHIDAEERSLFPAVVALEREGVPIAEQLIADQEVDHRAVGERLRALRALAGDYAPDRALCATHRALLAGLLALEDDLHQHIHEENNVLIPRVRRLQGAARGVAAEG